MKKIKKGLACAVSLAVMLIMLTATCFANDGMPVLTFEHNSYVASADSTITVGANVTDPGDSKPMSGVKVTFTLKDSKGNSTDLGAQTSNADGLVTCDVAVGSNFPYTLEGSASDGVNISSVKIKSDGATKKTEKKAEKKAEKSSSSSTNVLIIVLIVVVLIATILIIATRKKKNRK